MDHGDAIHTPYPQSRQWSNRILILSFSGILFLTLYPFHFDPSSKVAGNWSPFLLDVSHKSAGFADAFLNILLFIPFGLGLASYLRRRSFSWPAIFSAALLAGAICSYSIEFLQIYIPSRDSGWEDVFTNTAGSFAGALLFKAFGEFLLSHLSRWEQAVEAWCSTKLIAITILVYFGLWLAISIPLQHETRFTNWDITCPIYVGEDAGGRNAWKGRVTLLKIWNRPWHGDPSQLMAPDGSSPNSDTGLLATYDLTGTPPYDPGTSIVPPLVPLIHLGPTGNSLIQASSELTRLTTVLPTTGLIRELQKTNQLSLRIDFVPQSIDPAEGDILSISKLHGVDDLLVWQEGPDLLIHIRSPLASRGTRLRWEIRNVIVPNQPISVLISYDGSSAYTFVNGRKHSGTYYLSPGAGIMRRFIHINTYELPAYSVIYESLIFVPIGILLGMASRKLASPGIRAWVGFMLAVVLLPAILEALLVFVSGRAVIPSLVILGAFLTIAGFLWFNADLPA
jgi:glycopeptide antibiotics resistance protein